jgi:hypothetical protein
VLDLWQVLGAPSEYRLRGLVLAGLVTGGIFYVMVNQEGAPAAAAQDHLF